MKNHRLPLWKTVVARIMVVIMIIVLTAPSTSVIAAAIAAAPKLTKTSVDILEKNSLELSIKNKIKNSTYTWSTSNKKIATVDKKGIVKGIKKGTAVITCSVKAPTKTYNLTCKVNIRKAAISIKINNKVTALNLGQTYNLNTTKKPFASNDPITWTSSNKKIAVPDKNGRFTTLKTGKIKITAKAFGGKSDSVTIKVVDKNGTVTNQKELTALLGSGVKLITIKTDAAIDFTIPSGNYKKTVLVVDAPNSVVHNEGLFASVTIKRVKAGITPAPTPREEKPTLAPAPDPGSNNGGNTGGNGSSDSVSITFMDGSRVIETRKATKGESLNHLPGTDKTSKDGYVFDGWYTDAALSTVFYGDDKITADKTVYAKYTELPEPEYTPTSYAQVDQAPGLTFEIVADPGSASDVPAILSATSLVPKDGTDVLPLEVKASQGGVYTIGAAGGFAPGSSYELTLAEGYSFSGKPKSIRTASFTIYKEEVQKLSLNDDIVFIQDTPDISYTLDGKTYDVLEAEYLTDQDNKAIFGTFGYTAQEISDKGITTGTILCFYLKVSPQARNYIEGGYSDDPEVYVKVTGVAGSTVSFAPIGSGSGGDSDMEKIYFMPDTFPMKAAALPTGETGTINWSDRDSDASALIGETAGNGTLDVGDFLAIYNSMEELDDLLASDVYLGEVTGYDLATGVITYKRTTSEQMKNSMGLFVTQNVSGDELTEDVDKDLLEAAITQSVKESGFAEDAVFLLAELATNTKGFQSLNNLQDIMITDESGKQVSQDELALMGIGGSFELSDDVKLTVILETDKNKLHIGDGVGVKVGIDAVFSVNVGDEGDTIKLDLSATFAEELALGTSIKASDKWKWYGPIPVLKSLRVDAALDLKNYTALSVYVNVYSVAAEDESVWDKVDSLLGGQYSETLDKIQELENKISQAKDTASQLQGYKDEVKELWKDIPSSTATAADWEAWGKKLEKTDITKDLLGLLNLSTEAERDAGLTDVLQQYHDMMQKESEWIKLFQSNIFDFKYYAYGLVVGCSADFVVRADVNVALGTNLEYQVGKRYSFWFDIVKRTSGSSTMDLLDEKFAFQFYVMGKLGLKMGVAARIYAGIGTGKLASMGITTEFGPYLKMYGLFVYEYSRNRPANTNLWVYDERMYGGLYLDFGLYLIVSFDAQALWIFEYRKDLVDEEYPLLTAGSRYFNYDFATKLGTGEVLRVKDEDSNSSNGITMTLPESYLSMAQLDLVDGTFLSTPYGMDKFNTSLSNRNFSIDPVTGKITVKVPDGVQYMTCDLTLTWKFDKVAFSSRDITLTIPLVWTNLSSSELKEFFTARVRVGNNTDGYTTVWSKRVQKNEPFTLPTQAEMKALLGYDSYNAGGMGNLKYAELAGYGSGAEGEHKIYRDTVYDFKVSYRKYTLTVKDVEKADGTKEDRAFTANYGEAFDLTSLMQTGTSLAQTGSDPDVAKFTKFAGFTYTDVNGNLNDKVDIKAVISNSLALSLLNGDLATANYTDNSAVATFSFSGITASPVKLRVKAGTQPSDRYTAVADAAGASVTGISPAISKIYENTDYTVTCKVDEGQIEKHTITFVATVSGSAVSVSGGAISVSGGAISVSGGAIVIAVKEYKVGAVITPPDTPLIPGYTFDQWYLDEALTTAFVWENATMPDHDFTLYGGLRGSTCTITLNANGGEFDDGGGIADIGVTYGSPYGALVEPKYSGKNFIGWFTQEEGGTKVDANTIVGTAQNHTLYAHWTDRLVINRNAFLFTTVTTTYQKGNEVSANYQLIEAYQGLDLDSFTFKYRKQGGQEEDQSGIPVGAGTYDVVVTRNTDEIYERFEERYTGVVVIGKAVRSLDNVSVVADKAGYTFLDLKLAEGAIDDLSPEAAISYGVYMTILNYTIVLGKSSPGKGYIGGLVPGLPYKVKVSVTGDPNYMDVSENSKITISTLAAPTDSWENHTEEFTVTDNQVTISSAGQLAYLAQQVNNGISYDGVTITLVDDIDLTGYSWVPIGNYILITGVGFKGTFNGNNHTIRGLYVTGNNYVGLFGYVDSATIKNLRIEESYIVGDFYVGGFVGAAYNSLIQNCINSASVTSREGFSSVGGIAGGVGGNTAKIDHCVNYGSISGEEKAGGIVGYVNTEKGHISIVDCVNYGLVNGTGDKFHTGGIVGYQDRGKILNCANFGSVTGVAAVGGVIGENYSKNAAVENCYNIGTVKGTGNYVGAVVGRNTDDDGTIAYCYYLNGSATRNGEGRNGVGTKSGSLSDGDKGTKVASFTSASSDVSKDYGYGRLNLITILNARANDYQLSVSLSDWVAGSNNYPVPENLPQK